MGRFLLGILVAGLCLLPGAVVAQVVFGAPRIPPSHVDPPADRHDRVVARPDAATIRPDTPHGGVRSTIGGPFDDLFRAGPDTYAPRYDRLSSPYRGGRHLMRGYGYFADGYSPFAAASSYSQERSTSTPTQDYLRSQPPSEIYSSRADPYTPLTAAGPPKTFYVIPRCYAGDTPPQAEQLPAGCDVADVRTVPPVLR